MWALGVTLYFFSYGEAPFRANSIIELYRRIQQDPLVFPEPSRLPANQDLRLHALLARLLTKEPEQRLLVHQAFLDPWVSPSLGGRGRPLAPVPSPWPLAPGPQPLAPSP